eukprot:TRINITY_DN682_c1_g1_i1.p4 TRINITY_DN682_c1_g1~~TRINITY_DN682_c1_g1_i1.p4  ORF type:complete len:154 (+),score=4.78 TRINITY_DN682_c1_g1_i1:689-1150(+)
MMLVMLVLILTKTLSLMLLVVGISLSTPPHTNFVIFGNVFLQIMYCFYKKFVIVGWGGNYCFYLKFFQLREAINVQFCKQLRVNIALLLLFSFSKLFNGGKYSLICVGVIVLLWYQREIQTSVFVSEGDYGLERKFTQIHRLCVQEINEINGR